MKSNALATHTCPICQQLNHCKVDDFEHCWCREVSFDQQLLATVAKRENNQPKSCICQQCAEKASSNPVQVYDPK